MQFFRMSLFMLAFIALPGVSYAQSCAKSVAGQSMAQMISRAGGADRLYRMSQGQIKEYDRWLVQMEHASRQGIRRSEIRAQINQGKANREIERKISAAARCYMGRR